MPTVSRDTPRPGAPTAEQQRVWEEAAHTLLAALNPATGATVLELAYVHNHIPLWAMVMGHVQRAYETGELSAPVLDAAWPRAFPDLPDVLATDYKCERCKAAFRPTRFRQRYCSTPCGTEAAREALVAEGRL